MVHKGSENMQGLLSINNLACLILVYNCIFPNSLTQYFADSAHALANE